MFDPNGAYTGLNARQSVVEQIRYTIVDARRHLDRNPVHHGRRPQHGPVLQPDKTVTVDQDSGAIGLSITSPSMRKAIR